MQKRNEQDSKLPSLKTFIQMLECLLLHKSTYFIFLHFLGDCIRWYLSFFHLWFYAITNNQTWKWKKWACLPYYWFSHSMVRLDWSLILASLGLDPISQETPHSWANKMSWPLWLNSVNNSRCTSHLLSCFRDRWSWNEIDFKVLVGLIFCGYS